jgi:hypothetical protein
MKKVWCLIACICNFQPLEKVEPNQPLEKVEPNHLWERLSQINLWEKVEPNQLKNNLINRFNKLL